MRSIWSLLSAALLVGVGPAVVDASLLQPVTPIPIESSQQSCFMETAFMIDRPPSNDPYTMFTDHFSIKAPNTETFLHAEMRRLYPNSSVTVTKAYAFNLLAYAGQNEDPIIMQELEMESLKKLVYIPPASRRYGSGLVAESVDLGGWTVGWRDQELKVIVASWNEGFQHVVQWHLISDEASTAQDLFRAVSVYTTTLKNAILVFDQGYWQPDHNLWESVQKAEWKDVILNQEFKDRLQQDYRSFYKSEQVYKDLQVPWKRGLIFLGPPGNGKTISLKAIMHESKVPVLYVKSFHNWGGDEAGIKDIFARARAEAPCLLVLEDLDSLITDMNRSFFLNEVDGIEGNDGLLLIGTTNHFDRLDPALSSRPSRFDRKYSFPNPSESERRQYAQYWQDKLASNKAIEFPDELLDQFAERTDKFSFAYMKEVFISSLLTLAGLEDPKTAPTFQSVVLDQIKHLRKQLDEDEQALLSAQSAEAGSGGSSGGRGGGGGRGPGRQRPTLYSSDEGGLPLFVPTAGEEEDVEVTPPMLVLQST